MAIQVYWRPL